MFEQRCDTIQSHKYQNDLVACNLLKSVKPHEQIEIMNSIENVFLQRILNVAILQEEYELCHLICGLMKERFHDQ
jgi:hypothetical protein